MPPSRLEGMEMEAVPDKVITEARRRPCAADKYRRPGLDPPRGMRPGSRFLLNPPPPVEDLERFYRSGKPSLPLPWRPPARRVYASERGERGEGDLIPRCHIFASHPPSKGGGSIVVMLRRPLGGGASWCHPLCGGCRRFDRSPAFVVNFIYWIVRDLPTQLPRAFSALV